jgi:Neutral/alkaline non-lysosomal ceramidase, N-terminal
VSGGPGMLGAAAAVDVTPPSGLRMAGYSARGDSPSTGTHDPLEAAIVWLRSGSSDVVWVALDAVGVDTGLAGTLSRSVSAALGCAAGAVHVSATHTHSGPAGWIREPLGDMPRWNPSPTTGPAASGDDLVAAVTAAAAGLRGSLEPVRLSVAEGTVEGLGSNRDDPSGPYDPSLGALTLLDAWGRVLALVLDHGCHPTVLGHANRSWSADWPGAMRRALRGALEGLAPGAPAAPAAPAEGIEGRTPVVAVLQGASGDVSTRFTRRDQTFAEVDRLGGVAAARALDAILAQMEPVPAAQVVSAREVLTVRTRSLPDPQRARAAVEAARGAWRRTLETFGPGPAERIARTRHEGAAVALAMAEGGMPAELELPVAAIALGDTAWIEVPVELFSAPALEIRKQSPFRRTRVVGCAGGYFGYVADQAAHDTGVYEALASPFGPEAAEQIGAAAVRLLERVHANHALEERWATTATR